MKKARLSLAKAGAIALALTMALTGCGGTNPDASGGDSGQTATTEDTTQHWYQLSSAQQDVYVLGDAKDAEGYKDASSWTESYERDENGLVQKKEIVYVSDSEWGTTTTNVTSEYTYDDEGWLTAEKRTETTESGFTYEDESGEMVEESDTSEPVVTEIEYTLERDDEGRVVKAASSGEGQPTLEFTYDEDGNVAQTVRHENVAGMEDGVDTLTTTTTYTAEGVVSGEEIAAYDEFGEPVYVTIREVDEEGVVTREVKTRSDDNGENLVETTEYTYERDGKGNIIKQTAAITGDGVSTTDRMAGGESYQQVRETFMPDGTIKAQEIALSPEGDEVVGEEKSYDGPYNVVEMTIDENGNTTSYTSTYYDGTYTSFEATYDDKGNLVARTDDFGDGTVRSYEYTYDENGNQLTEKLVDNKSPEGVTRRLQSDETTYEWVEIEEPAPFLAFNDTYLWWY